MTVAEYTTDSIFTWIWCLEASGIPIMLCFRVIDYGDTKLQSKKQGLQVIA